MGTRYLLEHGVGARRGSTQGRRGTPVHGRLTGAAISNSRRCRPRFGNRSGVIPERWRIHVRRRKSPAFSKPDLCVS